MAVKDYNKKKKLEVNSVNDGGTTQDKAQPVLLVGGDDSTTGTGDVVLDWTNISSESDIAVYDQNGNLLPYEIESFDATAETATLWCYNSWTRDDSVRAQVVYGDGPTSSEENVTGTWNNTGQNAELVSHLAESSGSAFDSSPNANNSVSTTGTTYDVAGEINGAREGDGTDDNIQFPELNTNGSDATMVHYTRVDTDGVQQEHSFDDQAPSIRWAFHQGGTTDKVEALTNNGSSNVRISTQNYDLSSFHMYGWTYEANTAMNLYVDGDNPAQDTSPGGAGQITDGGNYLFSDRTGTEDNLDGVTDAVRYYSDIKSQSWFQAEYDASPMAGQVYFSQQAAESTSLETNETATITTSTANAVTATETGITNETATLTTTLANILTGTETATTTETSQITQVTVNSLTATETSTANETSTLTQALTNPLTGSETSSSTESATLTNITANTLQSSETATFAEVNEAAQLTTIQAVTNTSTEKITVSETASLTTSTTNLLTASETRDALETATVTQINVQPIQSTNQSTANETAEITTLTGKLIQAVQEGIINETAKLTTTTAKTIQDDTEAVANETSETVTAKANALKQFVDIFGRTKKATLDIKKKTKKTLSGDIDK